MIKEETLGINKGVQVVCFIMINDMFCHHEGLITYVYLYIMTGKPLTSEFWIKLKFRCFYREGEKHGDSSKQPLSRQVQFRISTLHTMVSDLNHNVDSRLGSGSLYYNLN